MASKRRPRTAIATRVGRLEGRWSRRRRVLTSMRRKCWRATCEPHPQAVLRAQRDRWLGRRPRRGQYVDVESLGEGREQENGFELREGLPDAKARAAPEGEVGES